MTTSRDASHGFAFSQDQFRQIVEDTLAEARRLLALARETRLLVGPVLP